MMKNKLYLAFIVVLIDYLWAARIPLTENNCPVNEYYNENKICEATCPNSKLAKPCVDIAVKGCQCIIGFVRNGTGTCIHPEDCFKSLENVNSSDNSTQDVVNIVINNEADKKNLTKNECSDNEHFNETKACELTCDCKIRPDPCTEIVTPACECNDGYVRSITGTCIKPDFCDELSQSSVLNDNVEKLEINVVLNNDTMDVQKDDCPENEHFNKHKACESTCQNLVNSDLCTEISVEACECNDGYVRNEQGTCIEPSYCDEFLEYPFLRDESIQNDDSTILDDSHDILDGFLNIHKNLVDRYNNESNNANTYNSASNSYRVYRSLISEAFKQKNTIFIANSD